VLLAFASELPASRSPPLNLQAEELLSAVVERLLIAVGKARPSTVRQFFGLVNQHIRWELNDLAQRLIQRYPTSNLSMARRPRKAVARESARMPCACWKRLIICRRMSGKYSAWSVFRARRRPRRPICWASP